MKDEFIPLVLQGFNGNYLINKAGQVKSIPRTFINSIGRRHVVKGKMLTPINCAGYKRYLLQNEGAHCHMLLHRLVALHFIPNPENKPQINHINGIKTDNRIENLEWSSQLENVHHAYKTGLARIHRGKEIKSSMPVIQMDKNGNKLADYESSGEAGRLSGVLQSCIWMCLAGKQGTAGGYRWKWA